MKTICLIIIALMLIVATPAAYACEGGGESEGGGEGEDSTVVDRVVPFNVSWVGQMGLHGTAGRCFRIRSGKATKVDKKIQKAIEQIKQTRSTKNTKKGDGINEALGQALGKIVYYAHLTENIKPGDALGGAFFILSIKLMLKDEINKEAYEN